MDKDVRATADRYYQAIHTHRARTGAPYRRVLVLGAGCGNDVAAALLNGAHRVDAVEIDPVLAEIGRERNPASPYRDPRVNLVVDDGRAFLARAEGKYDLILFALTDSLVKVSSMSQLRLENYLFTVESVQRAWHLLASDGDLVLYNFYRQSWLRKKIEALVGRATGGVPRIIFAEGDFAALSIRKRKTEPGAAPGAASIAIPTDDWPFLYLRERRIPSAYRKAMVAIGALPGLPGGARAGHARQLGGRDRHRPALAPGCHRVPGRLDRPGDADPAGQPAPDREHAGSVRGGQPFSPSRRSSSPTFSSASPCATSWSPSTSSAGT